MDDKKMKEYFSELAYQKLDAELKEYKERMFQLSPEEVFTHAYEIDSYINIYEILLEKIEMLEATQLWALLILPHILGFFYMYWLEVEDSHARELDEAISCIIEKEWNVVGEFTEKG